MSVVQVQWVTTEASTLPVDRAARQLNSEPMTAAGDDQGQVARRRA